jgi:hypothetical protein
MVQGTRADPVTVLRAVMVIVKTRIRSVFSGVMPVPIATQGAH